MRKTVLGIIIALSLLAPAALAKLPGTMQLDLGWGGQFRAQRWNPVQITLADPTATKPYPARLQIYIPHDSSFRMIVSQGLMVTPQESPYLVYLPLPYSLDGTTAVVNNAETGKTVARVEFDQMQTVGGVPIPPPTAVDSEKTILLGVSGQRPALHALAGPFGWANSTRGNSSKQIAVGYLPSLDLPDAMQGYESLDLLVLNAPDLSRMPLKTQQAIVAWVRAGGRLLLWPGISTMPPDSPIAQILPCALGDAQAVSLSIPDTRKLGVAPRNERLPGWKLEPKPGAAQRPFLLDKAILCSSRAGYGAAGVLSIDPSSLVFNSQTDAARLFEPILRELLRPTDDAPVVDPNFGGYNVSLNERWRSAAVEQVVDRLGNVPGIGSFSFGYIAIVLVALMFIVGPIDYFVLKKLGRQPWTWATIAGWVGLITLGGLYAGHIFRSGDLHYRTVRLIDQDGDSVVASLDMAAIYSPKTRTYDLAGPNDAWWEPVAFEPSDVYYYRGSNRGHLSDIDFVQDRQGQRLMEDSMSIHVWDLRFLQGKSADPQTIQPLLKAKARLGPGRARLSGSITNLGASPLQNVCIRHNGKLAMITAPVQTAAPLASDATYPVQTPARTVTPAGVLANLPASIAPRQTLEFQVDLALDDAAFRIGGSKGQAMNYWEVGNTFRNSSMPNLQFVRASCDLAMDRTSRVEALLKDDSLACIYAETESHSADVKLISPGMTPKERHWQVVRALVPVSK